MCSRRLMAMSTNVDRANGGTTILLLMTTDLGIRTTAAKFGMTRRTIRKARRSVENSPRTSRQ